MTHRTLRNLLTGSMLITTLASCSSPNITFNTNTPTAIVVPTTTPTSTPQAIATNVVQGVTQLIKTDLQLFAPEDDPNTSYTTSYYQAGEFTQGKYQGYKRIVALRLPNDPSGPAFFTFATKNDQHYVVDTTINNTYSLSTIEPAGNMAIFNQNKVTTKDQLDTALPNTIKLDNYFALYRDSPYYYVTPSNENIFLVTDFTGYTSLPVPQSNLDFYAIKPLDADQAIINNISSNFRQRSTIAIVDAAGLAYTYHLTTNSALTSFPKEKADYLKLQQQYDKLIDDAVNSGKPYPTFPPLEYPHEPNIQIQASDLNIKTSLFSKYSSAFIPGCSQEIDTIVVNNVKDSELQKIATMNGNDIWTINNANHDLVKRSYDAKVANVDNSLFTDYNKHQPKPNLTTYASKKPLLFIHDYWNRLLALQEDDYAVPGECGKPVVYLYPENPTPVSVTLLNPIHFTTTIPTYHHGWKVLAQPNGTLVDLQSQFTDCNAIQAQAGSEYAMNACEKNQYPYLYWSGQVLDQTYPLPQDGWVVSYNNLSSFMEDTLTTIGFSQQEKTDMLAYWLPKMLNKKAPYYRVSFLQTTDMNRLAPMQISPKPDHVFRFFLDYQALAQPINIKEPTLEHISRTGFTVIEWGGLKQ